MNERTRIGVKLLLWVARFLVEVDEQQAKELKAIAVSISVMRSEVSS